MEDLFTVFHEMGHVYYFLSYKDQPHIYRDGANPGTFKFITLHDILIDKHMIEKYLIKFENYLHSQLILHFKFPY